MLISLILTLMSSIMCVTSDIFSLYFKGSIEDLLFLRFLLAFLMSLCYYRTLSFISKKNIIRGILLSSSLTLFTYGLRNLPFTLVILINFATPIWTILFSKIFFNEPISNRIISCIINTLGIFIAIYPKLTAESSWPIISLLAASILFALTEVANKIGVDNNEKIPNILTGTAFFACICFMPRYSFTIPSQHNIIMLIGISACSLLIPLFTLLASKNTNLSALQPLKYAEFPMSIITDAFLLKKNIYKEIYYGFSIIFIGTIINYIYEFKKSK